MAVQRVAHLGAKGVPSTETRRLPTAALDRGGQRVEHGGGRVPRRQQLVTVLTGVPGTAHPDRNPVELRVGPLHVIHAGRQSQGGQHLGRPRALDGQDGIRTVLVGDRDPFRGGGAQRGDHRRGVGGVRDQEDLVVADVVGDQIVGDPPGRCAAQGVLGSPGTDPAQIVGQRGVDEIRCAGTPHQRLAQMADVEEPDGLAGGPVLADRAGVGDGHQPSAELGEGGAAVPVPFLERSVLQIRGVGHVAPP